MKFDKLISFIVSLGVPGLVLLIVMSFSGYAGAATITSSLAFLGGPFGMIGGIGTLLILSQVSKYGTEKVIEQVMKSFVEKGYTKESLLQEIETYPMPYFVKQRVQDFIVSYFDK